VASIRHKMGIDPRKGKTPSFEWGRRTPIISQSDPKTVKLPTLSAKEEICFTNVARLSSMRASVAAAAPVTPMLASQTAPSFRFQVSRLPSCLKLHLSHGGYARNGQEILNWDTRIQDETSRSPRSGFDRLSLTGTTSESLGG
jgi:hypothetical protein